MSMPSASWAVQMGVMVRRARDTSRQDRPAMLPESSIRKMVSNWLRNAYGSSGVESWESMDGEGDGARALGMGFTERLAKLAVMGSLITGPEAAVGEGEYAGGGSLEGTVNAFIPGRSSWQLVIIRFLHGYDLTWSSGSGTWVSHISFWSEIR